MTTARARAASRAAAYADRIAALHASGDHQEALAVACGQLRAEVVKAVKAHPAVAAALCRQLTDRIGSLAAAVPGFRHPGGTR